MRHARGLRPQGGPSFWDVIYYRIVHGTGVSLSIQDHVLGRGKELGVRCAA